VAGSPRSDDDKAGTPLAGLSCSCWVLHKPIEKSSAWGQKTPYYNRPTQDGLRGHFVLRAIGKRFRKDRTAGCEKVVGIRFALDSSLEGDGFEPSVPRQKDNAFRDSSFPTCARATAAFENARRPVQQLLLPVVDPVRMNAELTRQLGDRPVPPTAATTTPSL